MGADHLFEPAAAILRRVVPRIWRSADEGADRLSVAEVDKLHGEDFIDDAGQLAAGTRTLELNLPSREVECVRDFLENSDKNHVPIVDAQKRLVGMVTQTDLVAALYKTSLGRIATAG